MQRRDNREALASETLPELPIEDGVTRWNCEKLDELQRKARSGKFPEEVPFQQALFKTIDILGARSKIAQGINAPLTSVNKLRENKEYRLYLMTRNHRGLGILKIGTKKLFVTHPRTKTLVEIHPPCVLDFYVSEQVQRRGLGKFLYGAMLGLEGIQRPEKLAIDRPSPKFINFMKRHYNLDRYEPEVNNFVVFHEFFEGTVATERGQLKRIENSSNPPSRGVGGGTPTPNSTSPVYPGQGHPRGGRGGGRVGTPLSAGARRGGGPAQPAGRNYLAGRTSQSGANSVEHNDDMDRYLKGNPGGSLATDLTAGGEEDMENFHPPDQRVSGASGGAQNKKEENNHHKTSAIQSQAEGGEATSENDDEVFFDNKYERMAAELLKGLREGAGELESQALGGESALDGGRHTPGLSSTHLPHTKTHTPPSSTPQKEEEEEGGGNVQGVDPFNTKTKETNTARMDVSTAQSFPRPSPPRLRPQIPVEDDYPGAGLNAPPSTRFLLPPPPPPPPPAPTTSPVPPIPLDELHARYNGYYPPESPDALRSNVLLGGGGESQVSRAKGGVRPALRNRPSAAATAPSVVVHSNPTGNNHSAGAAAALNFEEEYSSKIPRHSTTATGPSTDTLYDRLEALEAIRDHLPDPGQGLTAMDSKKRASEPPLPPPPSTTTSNARAKAPAKRWGSEKPKMASEVGGHVPLLHTPPPVPVPIPSVPALRVPPPPPPASAPAAEKAAYDRYLDELEEHLVQELSASRERSKALETSLLHADGDDDGTTIKKKRVQIQQDSSLGRSERMGGFTRSEGNTETRTTPHNNHNTTSTTNTTTLSFIDYSGHGAGMQGPPLRYADLVRRREQADLAQLLQYRDPDYLRAARAALDPAAPKRLGGTGSSSSSTGAGRPNGGSGRSIHHTYPGRRSKRKSQSERRALWDPNSPANQAPPLVPFAFRHGLQRHREGEGPREFLPPLFAPTGSPGQPPFTLSEPYPLPVLLPPVSQTVPTATYPAHRFHHDQYHHTSDLYPLPMYPQSHVAAPSGAAYPASSPNISSVGYNILS